jgi:hypothetical protein
MLIIYCLFIIISLFFSMASYDLAVSRINEDEAMKVSKTEANEYAKEIMKDAENKNGVATSASGLPPMEPMNTFTPGNQVPQAPTVSQPVNMTPIMSNDVKNSEFGTMGYDRDDNLAPVSNTAEMSAGFAPAVKPAEQAYLRPQNKFEPFANDPEPFAGNVDNLQAY